MDIPSRSSDLAASRCANRPDLSRICPVYARAVRVAPGIFETAAPHGLVDGQTVRFFGDAGPRDAVVQVVSDTAIRLDIDSPDVFIYGAWADDVLSVDYNAVTAAAIGAIQDLQERVAQLERK